MQQLLKIKRLKLQQNNPDLENTDYYNKVLSKS